MLQGRTIAPATGALAQATARLNNLQEIVLHMGPIHNLVLGEIGPLFTIQSLRTLALDINGTCCLPYQLHFTG